MHPTTAADPAKAPPCCDVADFSRPHYFHGRSLNARDFRREQGYHVEKDRYHNRLLHGWGIVCGLDVCPVPAADCEDERGPVVHIKCGAAIDCLGRDVVVRQSHEVALNQLLSECDRSALCEKPATVYLSVCYKECELDRTQPYPAGGCEPAEACQHGRVRESYRFHVSTERPDPGPACEPCCGTCGDECLELVAIADYDPQASELKAEQLSDTGRRALARHVLAKITWINWQHASVPSRDDATNLFAEGIEVRFSRPVRVESLPGTVELLGFEGGGGRSGDIYTIVGTFKDLPKSGLADGFVFQSTGDERLQYGDRVMITIRADFILDECGFALDGNHIGGALPTGNGTEGGDFVSWITVADKEGN